MFLSFFFPQVFVVFFSSSSSPRSRPAALFFGPFLFSSAKPPVTFPGSYYDLLLAPSSVFLLLESYLTAVFRKISIGFSENIIYYWVPFLVEYIC